MQWIQKNRIILNAFQNVQNIYLFFRESVFEYFCIEFKLKSKVENMLILHAGKVNFVTTYRYIDL